MALDRLKSVLSGTHRAILGRVESALKPGTGGKAHERPSLEETFAVLEESLIQADVGVKTTMEIVDSLKKEPRLDLKELKALLRERIASMLAKVEAPLDTGSSAEDPYVILVLGVNGAGKTTTIGKLAARYRADGKTVLLGAADTFRAAAVEQLEVWAERTGSGVVKHTHGGDPGAVAFDTVKAARARKADVAILDTAGRLHTKENLMEELKKVKRVIAKALPGAPHEVLLVLDASTGQNALAQAAAFKSALGVTGIALVKLDGTAKGGIIVPIARELDIPIRFIGLGEGAEDLADFSAAEFAGALI